MAQISDKSAAYTIRIKTPVFQALKKAERPGFNYRKLSELAIRHFVESGALDRLSTEKTA